MTVLTQLGTFVLTQKTRTGRRWDEVDRIGFAIEDGRFYPDVERGNHSVLAAILCETVDLGWTGDYATTMRRHMSDTEKLRAQMDALVGLHVKGILKRRMAAYVMERQDSVVRCRLAFEWNVAGLPVKMQEWRFRFEVTCVDDD